MLTTLVVSSMRRVMDEESKRVKVMSEAEWVLQEVVDPPVPNDANVNTASTAMTEAYVPISSDHLECKSAGMDQTPSATSCGQSHLGIQSFQSLIGTTTVDQASPPSSNNQHSDDMIMDESSFLSSATTTGSFERDKRSFDGPDPSPHDIASTIFVFENVEEKEEEDKNSNLIPMDDKVVLIEDNMDETTSVDFNPPSIPPHPSSPIVGFFSDQVEDITNLPKSNISLIPKAGKRAEDKIIPKPVKERYTQGANTQSSGPLPLDLEEDGVMYVTAKPSLHIHRNDIADDVEGVVLGVESDDEDNKEDDEEEDDVQADVALQQLFTYFADQSFLEPWGIYRDFSLNLSADILGYFDRTWDEYGPTRPLVVLGLLFGILFSSKKRLFSDLSTASVIIDKAIADYKNNQDGGMVQSMALAMRCWLDNGYLNLEHMSHHITCFKDHLEALAEGARGLSIKPPVFAYLHPSVIERILSNAEHSASQRHVDSSATDEGKVSLKLKAEFCIPPLEERLRQYSNIDKPEGRLSSLTATSTLNSDVRTDQDLTGKRASIAKPATGLRKRYSLASGATLPAKSFPTNEVDSALLATPKPPSARDQGRDGHAADLSHPRGFQKNAKTKLLDMTTATLLQHTVVHPSASKVETTPANPGKRGKGRPSKATLVEVPFRKRNRELTSTRLKDAEDNQRRQSENSNTGGSTNYVIPRRNSSTPMTNTHANSPSVDMPWSGIHMSRMSFLGNDFDPSSKSTSFRCDRSPETSRQHETPLPPYHNSAWSKKDGLSPSKSRDVDPYFDYEPVMDNDMIYGNGEDYSISNNNKGPRRYGKAAREDTKSDSVPIYARASTTNATASAPSGVVLPIYAMMWKSDGSASAQTSPLRVKESKKDRSTAEVPAYAAFFSASSASQSKQTLSTTSTSTGKRGASVAAKRQISLDLESDDAQDEVEDYDNCSVAFSHSASAAKKGSKSSSKSEKSSSKSSRKLSASPEPSAPANSSIVYPEPLDPTIEHDMNNIFTMGASLLTPEQKVKIEAFLRGELVSSGRTEELQLSEEVIRLPGPGNTLQSKRVCIWLLLDYNHAEWKLVKRCSVITSPARKPQSTSSSSSTPPTSSTVSSSPSTARSGKRQSKTTTKRKKTKA